MKIRFRFEKLNAWQLARELNSIVHGVTKKFPRDEQFAMTSQLRRASISVSSDIAEGSGRNSDKDFAHFLETAYGSTMEMASLIYLAFDQQYIDEPECEKMLDKLEEIAKKVAALNRSLDVTVSKTPFVRERQQPSTFDSRPSTA